MKKLFTRSIYVIAILNMFTFPAISQLDSLITISGSADFYFRSALNTNNSAVNGSTLAPPTSFANLPGFSLGMANIVGTYESDNAGFVADFVFGPRGSEAVFASGPSQNIINQMYGYVNLSEKVKVTLGNFNTFLGYEVISPTGNFNYSTSYMFSYGPFSHSGLKVDLDLGQGFSAMGGVFNPTDATDFKPINDYFYGGQLGYTNDNGGAWLNFLSDGDFFQIDLTTGWNATEDLYLGLNTTMASDNFDGVAGYVQYTTSDKLALGVRLEYFEDRGLGLLLGEDSDMESVTDITFSANYKIGNLTIIPEFRIDTYSREDFIMVDGTTGEISNKLSSFLLAAVYGF